MIHLDHRSRLVHPNEGNMRKHASTLLYSSGYNKRPLSGKLWGSSFFHNYENWEGQDQVFVNLVPKRSSSVEHLSHSEFDMTDREEMHEQGFEAFL